MTGEREAIDKTSAHESLARVTNTEDLKLKKGTMASDLTRQGYDVNDISYVLREIAKNLESYR